MSLPGCPEPLHHRLGGTLKLIADFGDEQIEDRVIK
jgi:hypothetical protein